MKIPATGCTKYGGKVVFIGISILVQRPCAAENAEGGGEYGKTIGKPEVPKFVVISSAIFSHCYRGSDVRFTISLIEVNVISSDKEEIDTWAQKV